MNSSQFLRNSRAHIGPTMKVTQLLILEQNPHAFLAQVQQARPGKFQAFNAYSVQEFESLANTHRQEVNTVVLGAAQTDEQVQAAKKVISQVWEEGGVQVLKIPASLLTPEGKGGGMMRWFLEHVEGAIEGECGCC